MNPFLKDLAEFRYPLLLSQKPKGRLLLISWTGPPGRGTVAVGDLLVLSAAPIMGSAACKHRGLAHQCFSASSFWGQKTGPNPTDRAKAGSKHHIITDAQGIPLAVRLTGANAHDVTQALELVDAIPAVKGKRGRPRKRPLQAQGDRGYDSEPVRKELKKRHIWPLLAKRGEPHGSGLGVHRWVVERSLSWLHQFRRLRVRYERRADIHEAFLAIGCAIICSRFLFQ